MRESLLTIPISEVMEADGCPICAMRNTLESRTVDYIMGAAMMEPDVRIETNKAGFCSLHFARMLKAKNRLSLALMLQTHLDQVNADLFARKKLFEAKDAKKKRLSRINESCFVCDKIDWGMERLMRTFFEMWEDRQFRETLAGRDYICLPHYDLLVSLSPNYLGKGAAEFDKAVGELVQKHIHGLYDDVSKYCSMYDYRNTGKDADWGSSKDSIERSITFLTSREP